MTDALVVESQHERARRLVWAVYARHIAGCCLHVVIDDGNVEDYFVRHGIERADDWEHPDCALAARALLSLTEAERMRLHEDRSKYELGGARYVDMRWGGGHGQPM